MDTVLVITAGELTRDPRAARAVNAAVTDGRGAIGLCVRGEEPAAGVEAPIVRVGAGRLDRRLRTTVADGGERASSVQWRELRGVYRLLRHLAVTARLAVAARAIDDIGVVQANDFDTLPAAFLIACVRRARFVYDAHEIYTQQEVDPPRLYATVVRRMEALLARRAATVITVNDEIAGELQDMLKLRRRPVALLNCPPLDPIEPTLADDGRLRAVYQGAMGPGRSIDDLLAVAESSPNVELTVRVKGADAAALRAAVRDRGLESNVVVAAPVPPSDLVSALREHHVGLVINRPVTRNDELVLPNKLFEYLMAGLAVVVPRLPSIGSLVEREGVGLSVPPGDPAAMGEALRRLDDDRRLLSDLRRTARHAAVRRFNAETQAEVLEQAWGSR